MLICTSTLGLAAAGCSEDFFSRWGANFRGQLASAGEGQTCGDGNGLSALVADCPMTGVCFSEACAAHDICYAFCEQPRRECDLSFYTEMTGICHQNFDIDDVNLRKCLYFAFVYYGFVQAYGGDIYPCNGATPTTEIGACCTPGESTICTEGEVSACSDTSVAFPGQSCADLDVLFGGCPAPANDDCEDAIKVCTSQSPASGFGQCAGGDGNQSSGRACELAAQNCLGGEACIPYEGEVFSCPVLGDNRLASADGAILGDECGFDLPNRFQADIWFQYVAPCNGRLSISMCRGTQYDATLAVYGGAEPECGCANKAKSIPIACDDDSCGGFQTGGLVSIPALEGMCYLIRVGGWSSDFQDTGAARGLSQLEIGILCE